MIDQIPQEIIDFDKDNGYENVCYNEFWSHMKPFPEYNVVYYVQKISNKNKLSCILANDKEYRLCNDEEAHYLISSHPFL